MRMRSARVLGAVLFLLSGIAVAWHGEGHHLCVLAAVKALPADLPAFFRNGAGTIAHCALDPDLFTGYATPELAAIEAPDHYIDLERLEGRPIPATRYELVKEIDVRNLAPREVGFLPYAVMEWTERLTVAFAEQRKWPENPQIKSKCLVYAGILGHYSTDLCQPLHTTIHHDGRVQPDGKVLFKGIHTKMDGLLEFLPLNPDKAIEGLKPEAFANLRPGVLVEIDRSHALVDKVYQLEPKLPTRKGESNVAPEVVEFAYQRLRASARFTAALYLTAWRNSEKYRLPSWHTRE